MPMDRWTSRTQYQSKWSTIYRPMCTFTLVIRSKWPFGITIKDGCLIISKTCDSPVKKRKSSSALSVWRLWHSFSRVASISHINLGKFGVIASHLPCWISKQSESNSNFWWKTAMSSLSENPWNRSNFYTTKRCCLEVFSMRSKRAALTCYPMTKIVIGLNYSWKTTRSRITHWTMYRWPCVVFSLKATNGALSWTKTASASSYVRIWNMMKSFKRTKKKTGKPLHSGKTNVPCTHNGSLTSSWTKHCWRTPAHTLTYIFCWRRAQCVWKRPLNALKISKKLFWWIPLNNSWNSPESSVSLNDLFLFEFL